LNPAYATLSGLLQSRMMFTGIEHFAIASPNPRRLAEWYVANLEFGISYEYAGNYFVEAQNGALIEIIPAEGERAESTLRSPGMRHIAITVHDFDGALQQLTSQGVKFEGEPYSTQGNRLAFFKDADGNLLHLIQREKPLPTTRHCDSRER
jgi:glyoxylase I family protein